MPSIDILFICLHGSAKSVIAAEHFRRMALGRGVVVSAASAGIHPDAVAPESVRAGLAADGIDIADYAPAKLTDVMLASRTHVVSLGCAVNATGSRRCDVRRWDDIPAVSEGYEAARDAIVAKLVDLLDEVAPP